MKLSRKSLTLVVSTIACLSILAVLGFTMLQHTASHAAGVKTKASTSHGHVNIISSGSQATFSVTSLTLTHNTKNVGTVYFVNQTTAAETVMGGGKTYTVQAGARARVSVAIGTTTFTLQANNNAKLTVTVN